MEISGKKQVNIREDNKSAVIDLLLQEKEATLLQLSTRLNLSHTAMIKVMRELQEKNVVFLKSSETATNGRPPRIYGINGDCAIACAVVVMRKKIFVYYFDMRGFEINQQVIENRFATFEELLQYAKTQVVHLKAHSRLQDRVLKYIHIGIPSGYFYETSFSDLAKTAQSAFEEAFPGIRIVVNRNVDYEMTAEKTYGLLKGGQPNAVLLNFDDFLCASLSFNGNVYNGDSRGQGLYPKEKFGGLNAVLEKNPQLISQYCAGEKKAAVLIENAMDGALEWLSGVLSFLDVREVVISGVAKKLGERFLQYMNERLGGGYILRYSVMGKDVQSALAGAVWLSTYSTLQEIILR
ncbi:MAG: hypothetical protein E7380_03820 [Clostridiales bacterium]|nr:hypothetical protein [Clostridiales bacterium]MBQ2769512.1 hypothetical protein [Clostridia bacterium]